MNFYDAMKELEKGNKVRNADLNYGTGELYKEHILTKEEKEYLSNVIKPFKNNVLHIIKLKGSYDNNEYIQIGVKTDNIKWTEYINLPFFISGSMYNNMKLDYEYSLKELGLDD